MATYKITFKRSGKSFYMEDHQFILPAAISHGLRPSHSCWSGTCLTCMVKVLEGEIDQSLVWTLDDADRKAGWALICIGKPKSDLIIDA